MSRTYTQALWNIVIPSAGTTVGPLVPPGELWVVRDITLNPPYLPAPGRLGHIFVQERATGSTLWGLGATDVVGTRVFHAELRQALPLGSGLQVDSYTAGWSVAVTGYVFTVA